MMSRYVVLHRESVNLTSAQFSQHEVLPTRPGCRTCGCYTSTTDADPWTSRATNHTCCIPIQQSGRILVIVVVHTVLQTVQMPGVYSAVYGTVHYKEPLKSFKIKE